MSENKNVNVLDVINYLCNNLDPELPQQGKGSVNRVLEQGQSFEKYIEELFIAAYKSKYLGDKTSEEMPKGDDIKKRVFSYMSKGSTPPDFILRYGDAIEVKKKKEYGQLQLNSSYPRKKLSNKDESISKECKHCEDCEGEGKEWSKDMLYILGNTVEKNRLKSILMIYGDVFSSDDSVYTNIIDNIHEILINNESEILKKSNGVQFKKDTKEIGKIDGIDKFVHLRIRKMWLLENPLKVIKIGGQTLFEKFGINIDNSFDLICIMSDTKYEELKNSVDFTEYGVVEIQEKIVFDESDESGPRFVLIHFKK